ncbi:MAG: ribonucleotide reductase N-terminal alpha domain-containing protein, partial [Pseudomonadota bacterium]
MSTSSAALPNPANVAIAAQIWDEKYRLYDDTGVPLDVDRDATFNRVARSVAAAEMPELREQWEQAYVKLLCSHSFVPGGRILSGAGASRQVTLFNCFVMDTVEDSMEGIFNSVRDSALTMQRGGGIGVDFSTLRAAGARVAGIGAEASGPVSFMQVWDAMCATIMSAGARRGAMMATLRCDHPDIETFIDAKQTAGTLTNFNISVLVTDAFMRAVAADAPWELRWQGTVWRTVSARALWHRIMRAAYLAARMIR